MASFTNTQCAGRLYSLNSFNFSLLSNSKDLHTETMLCALPYKNSAHRFKDCISAFSSNVRQKTTFSSGLLVPLAFLKNQAQIWNSGVYIYQSSVFHLANNWTPSRRRQVTYMTLHHSGDVSYISCFSSSILVQMLQQLNFKIHTPTRRHTDTHTRTHTCTDIMSIDIMSIDLSWSLREQRTAS